MDVTKQFYQDNMEHYFQELILVLLRSELNPIMFEQLTNMWIFQT